MPVFRLLSGPNMFFRPAAATQCTNKRGIWHGRANRRSATACQISRLSGQKCENLDVAHFYASEMTRWYNFYEILGICVGPQVAFKFLI